VCSAVGFAPHGSCRETAPASWHCLPCDAWPCDAWPFDAWPCRSSSLLQPTPPSSPCRSSSSLLPTPPSSLFVLCGLQCHFPALCLLVPLPFLPPFAIHTHLPIAHLFSFLLLIVHDKLLNPASATPACTWSEILQEPLPLPLPPTLPCADHDVAGLEQPRQLHPRQVARVTRAQARLELGRRLGALQTRSPGQGRVRAASAAVKRGKVSREWKNL